MTTYTIDVKQLKRTLKKNREFPIDRSEENFTLFTLEDGRQFYYCNWDNGLYDLNKNPLSEVTTPDSEYFNTTKETRSTKKGNKPIWLRVLLGHACNYDCSYCMQKDIGNPNEREKITTTDKFISQVKENLDFSRLQKIDLWGGETLLYWKTIVDVMQEFDREGLTWFIPTNGTPLMMKHVEFFKTLKGEVTLAISHDGPAHERLRGKEFLYDKIEVLKELQKAGIQFSFNPVISNTNYDLFAINEFFYNFCVENGIDLKRTAITWVVGHNHDVDDKGNSVSHVVHGENLDKFKNIIKEFVDKSIEQKYHGIDHKLMNNSLIDSSLGIAAYAKMLKKQILPTYVTSCGVDDEGVLSVDMKGNVRTCPHTDETYIGGHIENIPNVNLTKVDIDRYDSHCKSCEVFRLCKSNCPIDAPDSVFYNNCAIEKVYNKAIQNKAFELIFNKKLNQG